MNTIAKLFTKDELRARFEAAIARCRVVASQFASNVPDGGPILLHSGGIGPQEESVLAANRLRIPAAGFRSLDALLALTLREDGWHRPDIRLTVLGMLTDSLVIDVSWDEELWTDRLITGQGAFAMEPFIITGPSFPPWLPLPAEGEPWPKFELPILEVAT